MHTSTSPQYAIIASCDVAAAMMEPPGGTALVEESILESLDFRRAMRKVDKEWGQRLVVPGLGAGQARRPRASASARTGCSRANEKWHGFGDLAPGFNMLDPIKSTIVTPGLDVTGKFAKTGIPASIVTKYLAEHGVVVEKTGLYSFFIMFTIGITKGRWNTLLTALQQFKDDYDKQPPMWRILPEFCRASPRTSAWACATCARRIHETYAKGDVARLTTEMYLSDLQPAMKPSRRVRAHRAPQDRARADRRPGRPHHHVAADAVPARHPAADSGRALQPTIVDYLRFARDFNAQFPASTPTCTAWSRTRPGGRAAEYYVTACGGGPRRGWPFRPCPGSRGRRQRPGADRVRMRRFSSATRSRAITWLKPPST